MLTCGDWWLWTRRFGVVSDRCWTLTWPEKCHSDITGQYIHSRTFTIAIYAAPASSISTRLPRLCALFPYGPVTSRKPCTHRGHGLNIYFHGACYLGPPHTAHLHPQYVAQSPRHGRCRRLRCNAGISCTRHDSRPDPSRPQYPASSAPSGYKAIKLQMAQIPRRISAARNQRHHCLRG